MVDLGTLATNSTNNNAFAGGVSADGTIIAGTSDTNGAGVQRAFRWTQATGMVELPVVPGQCCVAQTKAFGISADGTVIVGNGSVPAGGATRALRWQNSGTPVDLGSIGGAGADSFAYAANADGTVVVGSSRVGGLNSATHAFRWTASGMVDLGTIGGVTGNSLATGVSADGSVVVGMSSYNGTSTLPMRAFRWTQATGMVDIGAGNSELSFEDTSIPTQPISGDGSVIGGYGQFQNGSGPARWTSATGARKLQDLLTAAGVSLTGVTFPGAALGGVSGNGQFLTGRARFANTTADHAFLVRYVDGTTPSPQIFAAVAPNARTTFFPGGPAVTGFATILNSGTVTAQACRLALPGGIPATLHYQLTNSQNLPVGSPDVAAAIPAGQGQTFVFSLTPSATFSTEIALAFLCANTAPAPVVFGLSTFLVTVGSSAISDMLSIADTPSNDGIANIPGTSGTGLIVTAAVNIGAAGTVVFTPSDTPVGQTPKNLPVSLSICQTNSNTGACINPATPGTSSTVTVASNQTVFFSIFIQGQGTPIPFDPANKRVFIIAKQGSTPVGEASAAIRTQ